MKNWTIHLQPDTSMLDAMKTSLQLSLCILIRKNSYLLLPGLAIHTMYVVKANATRCGNTPSNRSSIPRLGCCGDASGLCVSITELHIDVRLSTPSRSFLLAFDGDDIIFYCYSK